MCSCMPPIPYSAADGVVRNVDVLSVGDDPRAPEFQYIGHRVPQLFDFLILWLPRRLGIALCALYFAMPAPRGWNVLEDHRVKLGFGSIRRNAMECNRRELKFPLRSESFQPTKSVR